MLGLFCVVRVWISCQPKCRPSMFPVFAYDMSLLFIVIGGGLRRATGMIMIFFSFLYLPLFFVCVDCVYGCLCGCIHYVFGFGEV